VYVKCRHLPHLPRPPGMSGALAILQFGGQDAIPTGPLCNRDEYFKT
jgi:hypothetical protein